MSLFEDNRYQWRETYFVLFAEEDRPTIDEIAAVLGSDGGGRIENLTGDQDNRFESLTLFSPADGAAMDITYLGGEDVADSVEEVVTQLEAEGEGGSETMKKIRAATARIDIYHFEEIASLVEGADEDEHLDPGSLLVVMESIASLCKGTGFDPQAGELTE